MLRLHEFLLEAAPLYKSECAFDAAPLPSAAGEAEPMPEGRVAAQVRLLNPKGSDPKP